MTKKSGKTAPENEPLYDEFFAFISGYTSGGAPYGTTWEEEGIDPSLPLNERLKLLYAKHGIVSAGDADTIADENDPRPDSNSTEDPDAIVFLEDVAAKFEESMEEWQQFLNIKTGEFVEIPSPDNYDADFDEEDEELFDEIETTDDYVRLPEKYELGDFDIMQNYAVDYPDEAIGERLIRSLHGSKPFRRFKEAINEYGIQDSFYKYKSDAYLELAKEWCEDKGIRYKRRTQA